MIALLTTYWLEALLAVSGAVTVIGLLVNQIRQRKINVAMAAIIKFIVPSKWEGYGSWGDHVNDQIYKIDFLQKDFAELKSRLDLLDKPSNDKALAAHIENFNAICRAVSGDLSSHQKRLNVLEEKHNLSAMNKIATILNKKKKHTKKPISKAPIATSKPRRKANNGVGSHAR